MILYNPTEVEQMFYYGHIPYVFKPKESKTVEDVAGVFALKRGNRNLVKYEVRFDRERLATDMDYDTMPWKQVIGLAGARGIFKKGLSMKRPEIIAKLKEYDLNTQAGALPEPSDQEEGEGSEGPAIL